MRHAIAASSMFCAFLWTASGMAEDYQYEFEAIRIPKATAEEPVRPNVSLEAASEYLENGSMAWNGQRSCVSCHTNGTYMTIRPLLSRSLGPPEDANRQFFLEQLAILKDEPRERLQESTRPAQVIYLAAGLSEWDAHVTGALSPETSRALELMFDIQRDNGTWDAVDCWPPFESDAFHEATVAAMAVAAAPGWFETIRQDPDKAPIHAGVERLRHYLRNETPPHDYSRVLLLWAGARMKDLLPESRTQELIQILSNHQKPDGSWSIRTFAEPEAWGRGNRAEKLRAEPDFSDPAGDGHMTGLAIVVLLENGVPAEDQRIQNGIHWLKANQRESGRWWTRSLNTDSWHFITYSGTAYALLALQWCHELPGN